jgi:DNA-binding SARP family transcriptional activator
VVRLSLTLFGGFQARVGSGPPLALPTRKAQALLAYLGLTLGREHGREKLTALLWADAGERQARQSLRQALFSIRKAVAGRGHPEFLTEGETVGLRAAAVDVDVARFEQLLAEGGGPATAEAARLYQGDLLEGIAVHEPAFEDWLAAEQQRLRELARGTLEKILSRQVDGGLVEPAIQTAVRLLALDPFQETVHRTLMRLYLREGRRGAALRQYQVCVEALRRELGVEPEAETRQLYRDILQRDLQRDGGSPRASDARTGGGAARRAPGPGRFRADGPGPEAPLVGRESEVAWVADVLADAWRGRGRVLLITGEAGIGKTRLVRELTAEALRRDGRGLAGSCHATEQMLPFRPWVDALRPAVAGAGPEELAALTPVWRAELARLFPELGVAPPGVPTLAEDYVRLFEAVGELLAALAAHQRTLLVLEDLHWADEMSLRLLSFLGRRLQGRALLVVGTAREEDLGDTPLLGPVVEALDRDQQLVRMALGPLSQPATERLVRQLARAGKVGAVEHLAAQVWAVSDGNPLVVVETVRTLDERPASPAAGLPLPRRVRELIAARLARLGERSRHLAAVAAVVGGASSFALLQRAAGLGGRETADAVEELVRRRVLDAVGDGFDFTHDRVRDVVYESLSIPARQALHAAVGAALEALHGGHSADVSDRLAHHFSRADTPDKAVGYLVQFADRAARRHALEDAVRALQEALAQVERLPEPARDRRAFEVLGWLVQSLVFLGRFQAIVELLLPLGERLGGLHDPAVRAAYELWLGHAYSNLANRERAARHALQAVEAAAVAGDRITMGKAYCVLGREDYFSGRPVDGVAHAREAVAILEGSHERWWLGQALWMVAVNSLPVGNLDRGLEALARVRAVGEAIVDRRLQAFAAAGTGLVHAQRDEARAALEAGQRGLDLSPDPLTTAYALGFFGIVHRECGRASEGIRLLERAIAQVGHFQSRHVEAYLSPFLAECYLLTGEAERARDVAQGALDLSRSVDYIVGVAYAERALGRIAHARGQLVEAGAHLERARAIFGSIEASYHLARTHLDLARLAHARGNGPGLLAHLDEAGRLFAALGIARWTARVARLGRELGVRLATRPGPAAKPRPPGRRAGRRRAGRRA